MAVLSYTRYNQDDFSENNYAPIPEGRYRVRIENAEEAFSHNDGKQMIKLTLAVSGYSSKLWGYVIIDQSSPEAVKKTNQALGTVFNSFNISHGDLDLDHWIGRVGGVKVTHKVGNDGETRANVSYFLYRKEVDKLPAWRNPDGSAASPQDNINPDMVDFDNLPEGPVPF